MALMIYFLAVWRGGAPERIVGGLLLLVFVTDEIHSNLAGRVTFNKFETFLFLTDFTQLVVFTWLSIRANRLWPLVPAALKLVAVIGHMSALLLPFGRAKAYWTMVEVPAYFTIVALAVGLVAHWRRQRRIGPYPDWRPDPALR
ncbi:hypothetical protein [Croceibacterium ferulae]|uniref:hypothetical protein n=1 Tax=Croceibacterium ferulae TaxID=1854641 RepID=UPI000EAE16A1|nr:hypothetical protein [Croceibacterium ferulae]